MSNIKVKRYILTARNTEFPAVSLVSGDNHTTVITLIDRLSRVVDERQVGIAMNGKQLERCVQLLNNAIHDHYNYLVVREIREQLSDMLDDIAYGDEPGDLVVVNMRIDIIRLLLALSIGEATRHYHRDLQNLLTVNELMTLALRQQRQMVNDFYDAPSKNVENSEMLLGQALAGQISNVHAPAVVDGVLVTDEHIRIWRWTVNFLTVMLERAMYLTGDTNVALGHLPRLPRNRMPSFSDLQRVSHRRLDGIDHGWLGIDRFERGNYRLQHYRQQLRSGTRRRRSCRMAVQPLLTQQIERLKMKATATPMKDITFTTPTKGTPPPSQEYLTSPGTSPSSSSASPTTGLSPLKKLLAEQQQQTTSPYKQF